MVVIPDTDIILIKSPLKLDKSNQITFSNADDQYNYFSSLPKLIYEECTYQRKDGVIRYNTNQDDDPNAPTFEDLLQYNYCMYKNNNYSNKWFYAFITDCKYENDGMSSIKIETDVFQSWQFDINYMNSFIEREHVSDDTIGLHTIPEQLETGEYISSNKISTNINSAHVVITATYDCFRNSNAGSFINGIYHGTDYFLINAHTATASISYFLQKYASEGKIDAITGMFMIPDKLTDYDNISWDHMYTYNHQSFYPYKRLTSEIVGNIAKTMETLLINKPYTSIDSYVPKNKKLFVFPYVYLQGSNNAGSNGIYHYEEFNSQNCEFNVKGCITPGGSIRMIPSNYKGISENNEEGINCGKFPVCSYNTDVYINWLTQNSVNIGLSLTNSAISIAGGIGLATTGAGGLAGAGSIVSGAMGIAQTLGEVYQHSLIPPQVEGNLNCGDVTYSSGNTDFTLYQMNIKREYAKIIDDFFSMYGYKVNRLATPNIHKRSNWDYIKTIDVNLEGNIPEKDLDEIRNLFNNGITFWHTTSKYLDYSQTNSIL